jgi:signal transduction histidine kinase
MLVSLITHELAEEKQNNIQEMTQYLNESVNSMEKLIHGILESARLGYEEKKDFVDLNLVLEEVKRMINIPGNFSIRLEKTLPRVLGNHTKWIQVFQNLITNAIKFNKKEEGLLQVSWSEDDENYEFIFSDNGIVISDSKQHLIFRLFERASDEDDKQSHGIGLFIVKNIIQNAGGPIRYRESALGGSEFYFNWPKK